MTLEIEE